jgi:hypothetical protein
VTGRVQIDHRPAPDQRVLLVSGDGATLLGSTVTDGAGEYAVPAPDAAAGGTAVVLVKVRGPMLGVAHRAVDLAGDGGGAQDFDLDSRGPGVHELRATVESTAGWPPYLRIVVDPVHLAGLPAPFEPYLLRRDEHVVEESFFPLRVEGRSFALRLQAGRYRIGGGYVLKSRAMATTPQVPDYVVRERYVDVDHDGDVTLTIDPR